MKIIRKPCNIFNPKSCGHKMFKVYVGMYSKNYRYEKSKTNNANYENVTGVTVESNERKKESSISSRKRMACSFTVTKTKTPLGDGL